ncbi:hypothetical protein KR067_011422, partial [Drosophila pandora]
VTSEMEDECGSVFYPIVKPLLRYFEVCQTKDRKNAELQDSLDELNLKYSKLMEKHVEVHDKLNEENIKYRQLQESHTAAQREYHKVEVEFAEVREKCQQTNRELDKSQKILNETNLKNEQLQNKLAESQNKDEELRSLRAQIAQQAAQITRLQDQTSELGKLKDLFSEEISKLREVVKKIQLPGLEPFQVCCFSYEMIGSGWMAIFFQTLQLTDFNQTYDQYINGFGDVRQQYFIGLEKLHILTSQKPHE